MTCTNLGEMREARKIVENIKSTVRGDNPFMVPMTEDWYSLDFPNAWQRLSIVFRRCEDGRMMLRTFNWSAENEVHCIISVEQARSIYKTAVAAGYIPEPPESP